MNSKDFLPLDIKVLNGLRDAMQPTIGIAKVLQEQHKLMQSFTNPFAEVAKNLSSMTAVFGMTEVFKQHQDFAKAFRSQWTDVTSPLSEIMKRHTDVSQTLGSALKDFQPVTLSIANQLRALDLSTHFSSLAIPKGFIESLKEVDVREDNNLKADQSISEELNALSIDPDKNAIETLEKIQSILKVIQNELISVLTATTDSAERAARLITYDRIVNHLGIILSILLYFVQAGDQLKTDSKIASVGATTAQIKQSTEHIGQAMIAIEEKVCEVQKDLQTVMTIIAEPDLRVCTNASKLMNSPRTSSVCLGFVERFQIVNVVKLPIEHAQKKWLYVTYFDGGTGEPRAGWVLKKYFKKSKVLRNY
jgi:hypothetical protein